MNFITMQRQVWWHMGRTNEADILDWERQKAKDDLNLAFDEIMAGLEPYFWQHVAEDSLSIVSGTTIYTLAGDCISPLQFWTADERARPIRYIDPVEADWNHDRNSNSTASWTRQITWYPPLATAEKSGTDATVTTDTTALTKAGGTAWAATDVGKWVRLNGEVDLKISAFVSATSVTLARKYIGRLSGITSANSPSSLSSVPWEVTPVGTPRVELVPGGTESETVKYRYVFRHPELMQDTDVPLLPKDFHFLLPFNALLRNNITRGREDGSSIAELYGAGLARLRSQNQSAVAAEMRLRYDAGSHQGARWPYPRDIDRGAWGF